MFATIIAAALVCYGLVQIAHAIMMLATRGLTVYHKYGGKLEFERSKDGRDWKVTVGNRA